MKAPNKRTLQTLVNSLQSGVVPRSGLEFVMVGRKDEISALVNDLQYVADGAGAFRFIVGKYGSGKTFLLQTLRNYALDKEFVVMDADLSLERRLVGSKGQGLAMYSELMKNMAVKSKPNGGALDYIMQKWLMGLKIQAANDNGISIENVDNYLVENKIYEAIHSMQHMIHSYDFSTVLLNYWRCYNNGDDSSAPLKWFRGEMYYRRDAKKDLGVSNIINDENWYDYIKIWGEFVTGLGYKGLVVFLDEGVNLYKISHSKARNDNYEKLLTIFNDITQGKAANLAFFMAGTNQFVEDINRGLYSYEALRSRLAEGRFTRGTKSHLGPVMKLETLSNEEIFLLLENLARIHAWRYEYEPFLTHNHLSAFIRESIGMLGANGLLTPREIIRDFLGILNRIHQDENVDFYTLISETKVNPAKNDPDIQMFSEEFEI